MKAIILTSILTVLSLTNLTAGNPKGRVLCNVENHAGGLTKEYIVADKNLRPESKAIFEYDANGALLSRVLYQWNAKKQNWTTIHRHKYEYNEDGQVNKVSFTQWDNRLKAWSPKSQYLLHSYDDRGKLLSAKQIQVKEEREMFIVEK